MDLNKLSKGERILGISALALLILSFLPLWAKLEYDAAGFTERYSAWSGAFGFLLKLGLFLALVALVLVALKAFGTNVTLPIPAWQIYAACAAVTLVLLLLTVLTGPVGDQGDIGGYEWSRGLAVFIAPLLGAGMAYGAFMTMSDAGAAPTSTTVGGGPTSTPPPPAS